MAMLLISGRAGLRAGNIRSLARDAKKVITPARRVDRLRSEDAKGGAVSLECLQAVLGRANALTMATQIVDDLFPASRAVQESATASACLRLAIEHARLRVLQMLSGVRNTATEVSSVACLFVHWLAAADADFGVFAGWGTGWHSVSVACSV